MAIVRGGDCPGYTSDAGEDALRIGFRPREILAIACRLERDGAEFYRRAAEAVSDNATAALLRGLAQMEDDHLQAFQDMERQLVGQAAGDLFFDADVALRYLRAVSAGHVVDFSPDLEARLAECGGPEAILRLAIEVEKDSVVLYAGIQSMASDQHGWHAAQAIFFEEMEHIASLSERLESLEY